MAFSGDGLVDFLDRAGGAEDICPNCGSPFSFERGVRMALSKGIDEKKDSKQIVLCPHCFSAFTADFNFADGLKLLEDVTVQYPQAKASEPAAPRVARPAISEAKQQSKSAVSVERPCPKCGKPVENTTICSHCGHTYWSPITLPAAASIVLFAVAIFTSDCIRWGAAVAGALALIFAIWALTEVLRERKRRMQ